jgi:2,3-dihydroxy-2,3-dihydro-p-cumate dehydrogenase
VAIVTGAAQGIGHAIVARLIADGYHVAVSDIDEPALRAGLEKHPNHDALLVHVGDLSRSDVASALVQETRARFGRLDVLVNNAGGGVVRPFLAHDDESVAETISRNLLTTIHCCRAALPVMIECGGGRIVNLGAESVRNGLSAHAMYNAAKGGVHGLTTGLAREFAEHGITVNAIAPSIVKTAPVAAFMADPDVLPPELRKVLDESIGLIPMGRPATVEEVANVVAFAASPRVCPSEIVLRPQRSPFRH